MKKTILLLLILNIYLSCFSQESNENNYFPLTIGSIWQYKYISTPGSMKFEVMKKVNKNKKTYFKLKIKYSWGGEELAYYRYEDGQYYIFNHKKKIELIHIPKDIETGKKWSHNDGWEFEIMDVNSELKTPIKKYSELLKIKAIQIEHKEKNKGMEYFLFFQKGVGQIGTYMDGKLQTYLIDYKLN